MTRECEGEEPVEYICSVNIGRRHMTPADRAVFAASVRGPYAREAAERQRAGVPLGTLVEIATEVDGEDDGRVREILSVRFAASVRVPYEEEARKRERTKTYAAAKELVEDAHRVAGELLSATLADKPKPRGNSPEGYGVAKAEVAQGLGVAESTLRVAEQQVKTAESYPFMQRPQWNQSSVLKAREYLEVLPPTSAP